MSEPKLPMVEYGFQLRGPKGMLGYIMFNADGEVLISTSRMLRGMQTIPDVPSPEIMEYFKALIGRIESELDLEAQQVADQASSSAG